MRAAAAWLWSAWLGALTFADGGPALGKQLDAGLRIVVGGLAADAARETDETVRALLEPAARAPEPVAVRGLMVRREPVANALRAGLPGLALWTTSATLRDGQATPPLVRARVEQARERTAVAEAAGVPGESAPWAYRVAMRQLGIDPDEELAPVERAVLHRGLLIPELGMPGDALMAASLETGVPVRAFDETQLDGSLALRSAAEGEGIDGAAVARPAPARGAAVRRDARARAPGAVQHGAGARGRAGSAACPTWRCKQALWLAAELVEGGGR